jgi:hypothetical protein
LLLYSREAIINPNNFTKLREMLLTFFNYDFQLIENSPPVFHNGSSEILVKINSTESVTFGAKDPDGDTVQFSITSLPDRGVLKTNNSSITLEWNVTTEVVSIEM